MTHLNKNKKTDNKNNSHHHHLIAATATTISVFVIAIVIVSTSTVGPAAAQQTTTTTPPGGNNTTTSSAPSSSGIRLSSQPVYQERVGTVSQTSINQTHTQLTISGNGNLTLPNSTEANINTTSTGSIIVSQDGTGVGKEVLRTKDRSENATATFYEIARFNMQNGTGRGIIIALIHTNSTGKLAPLDGMILVGQQEFTPQPTSLVKVWEWHSGIPYLKMPMMTTTEGEPSSMNNTNNDTAPTTANELPPSSSSSSSPLTGP